VEKSLPIGYRLTWGGEYSEYVDARPFVPARLSFDPARHPESAAADEGSLFPPFRWPEIASG
jgi:hypothetical protein